ncbi:Mu transposase C-terminal domain-containing protein [Bosea sp. BK604]|uniref:Mu transposase C-terminal domain-containing protein n=1 Tax=Bosea sp. BK604 TaxID=2512180 RepID=UPI00104C7D8B|nr:Mu transposase C-terminal domain-containing protein [Bosea sp. BK604]TCR68177.1 Mu transposase-like protein [Bosea sp. BK604]
MAMHCFEEGKRVLLHGKRYRLLNAVTLDGREHWQLCPLGAAPHLCIIESHPTEELHASHYRGDFEFDEELDGDTPAKAAERLRRRARKISDRDEKSQKYMRFFRDVIREVAVIMGESDYTSNSILSVRIAKPLLAEVLRDLGNKYGIEHFGAPKNISRAQYYRMRKRLIEGGFIDDFAPNWGARGNRQQMHPLVSSALDAAIQERLDETSQRGRPKGSPAFSTHSIETRLLSKLDTLREAYPALAEKFRLPSRVTILKRLKLFPQYRIDVAREGVTRARMLHRRPHGHQEPEACLSLVQYDETRLPFYCVSRCGGIPLGRPWLSWLLDVYCGGFLGFYLGFEPAGDTVFASVLRHACNFKSYVSEQYPGFAGTYKMAGRPRFITFDNSLSAHGTTIQTILEDLDIPWTFSKPWEPWTKAHVESSFDVFNRALLQDMPGFVLSKEIPSRDYDPGKNACISFDQLLYIIHCWIVDYHGTAPAYRPEIGSPNQRWEHGTRLVKPEFLRKGTDLDAMFGIVRSGRLDHRGVRYENIYYYSDELHSLRHHHGASLNVSVKVNPADLSKVYVRHAREDAWIRCDSLEPERTNGLSLFCHALFQRHAKKLFGNVDREAYVRARLDLEEKIAAWRQEDLGVQANARVARALGFGTHLLRYEGSQQKGSMERSGCDGSSIKQDGPGLRNGGARAQSVRAAEPSRQDRVEHTIAQFEVSRMPF